MRWIYAVHIFHNRESITIFFVFLFMTLLCPSKYLLTFFSSFIANWTITVMLERRHTAKFKRFPIEFQLQKDHSLYIVYRNNHSIFILLQLSFFPLHKFHPEIRRDIKIAIKNRLAILLKFYLLSLFEKSKRLSWVQLYSETS